MAFNIKTVYIYLQTLIMFDMDDNVILQEISFLARFSDSKERKRYDKLLADMKEVSVGKLSDVLEKDEIDLIRSVVKPKPKMCYKNAFWLTMHMAESKHDIRYCEGMYTYKKCLPISHAFNIIDGVYVDITMELALKRDPSSEDYVVFGEYDKDSMWNVANETGVYGGVYEHTEHMEYIL